MHQRCGNAKHDAFHRYGGRGISVCEAWKEFKPFYEWAIASGYQDCLTIDRENNDKGYSPGNCRWITRAANAKKAMQDRKDNGESKLNPEMVSQIKTRIALGIDTYLSIAMDFGVSRETVNEIALNKTWIEVEPILEGRRRKNSLTVEQAKSVKALLSSGINVQAVADLVGVSKHAVTAINIGRAWRKLDDNGEVSYPIVKRRMTC